MSQTSTPEVRIAEMVRRIVRKFHPDKVILFGSYARGAAGPDSDVDLLVVMPVEGSERDRATDIDVELFGTGLPADVIVITPQRLERSRNLTWSFIPTALAEGKVLYARSA